VTWLMVAAAVMLVCAAIPCVMFGVNLRRYTEPESAGVAEGRVAVLIPARNEEGTIGECVGFYRGAG
jgi:hypothetical protein